MALLPRQIKSCGWESACLLWDVEDGKCKGAKTRITGVKFANGTVLDNWTIAPEDMTYNTEFTKRLLKLLQVLIRLVQL